MDPSGSLLFASALTLSNKLASGETSSVELIRLHLGQIKRHNHQGRKLNAVISSLSLDKALEQAAVLDEERKQGRLRSVLHGLPIVVKDAIVTDSALGMPTTAGTAVFSTMKAKANAPLINRLVEAGLVILAKTNVTEFCGMKAKNTGMGWSSIAGQTLSAYRQHGLAEEDQPFAAGSSSGSAVSVSAGFAPLAISTETAGSTVYPASASGIYGMRLTSGTVPVYGVQKLSVDFDAIGVMARDPADLLPLAEILQGREPSRVKMDGWEGGLEGFSVGVFKSTWGISGTGKWDTPEVTSNYEAAANKLKHHGCRVVYPIDAPGYETLKYKDETLTTVAYHQFPGMIEEFISCFEENPEITSLKDIIKWNEEHSERALPPPCTTQTELVAASQNAMPPALAAAAVPELRRLAGVESVAKVMDEQGLDIVLAASESTIVTYSACLGWPIASVPIARLDKNGQPYGMFAMAREGREGMLVRFMKGWEEVFGRFESPILDS